MGISMGTISFADYLAENNIHVFLLDMRGYGMSSVVENQTITTELFYSDITATIEHIKQKIPKSEISIFGFSLAGALCVGYATKNPDTFKNIIVLNTQWKRFKNHEPNTYGILDGVDATQPYWNISLDKIKNRLEIAQLDNKNFIEPLWYKEASDALKKYHTTYDDSTNSWKIPNYMLDQKFFEDIGEMRYNSRTLVLSSQYDNEMPYFVSSRLHKEIRNNKKYLLTVPNATHLCIWEKQREYVYNKTAELVK
jgi:pimeloyl-ACP methyl ester carboxylesterase